MAGEGSYGRVLDGGISRARFLKLAGLGAGLSLSRFYVLPERRRGPGVRGAGDPGRHQVPHRRVVAAPAGVEDR
jgi:hypothetical protein